MVVVGQRWGRERTEGDRERKDRREGGVRGEIRASALFRMGSGKPTNAAVYAPSQYDQ